jgi:hypothetical protein
MRAVVAVSKTCFSASIASRRGGRGWLETQAPRMIAEELSLLRRDSIGASDSSQGRGEESGTRRRAQKLTTVVMSSDSSGRITEFRREICAAWRRLRRGTERGITEGVSGIK